MSVIAGNVTEAGAERHSAWRSVGRSAGMRIFVLPVSAILGIVNTRLIIDHFGSGAYAQYGLLVGIGSLIPFADLGMSAALMNAVAESDDPSTDPKVRKVLTTAIRVLVGSALTILLVTALITWAGWWPRLLGNGLLPHTGATSAALCAAMIAISMPAGVGQRILTGLGKNHVSIALLGLQTPVVLICLVGMISTGTRGGTVLPVIPYVVTFAISLGCSAFAARRIGPVFAQALRDAPRVASVRGGKVFDVAWPMLVQMIALPIAMQTDRLILSHVSDLKNLAEYNLASQMYLPVWQVVSSAGVALWPIFAKARTGSDTKVTSPMRLAAAFGGAAAAVCVLISLVAPWLSARASGGDIHL
ncbi:MAG: Membrane protein involved in the export of O-antigen and teichoic acid, partial [Pseudonocardiales bacterium]|nr:Membrane protein involved in the export of O-antigen and teichoic acid [Pseudonocardiales bacterium]